MGGCQFLVRRSGKRGRHGRHLSLCHLEDEIWQCPEQWKMRSHLKVASVFMRDKATECFLLPFSPRMSCGCEMRLWEVSPVMGIWAVMGIIRLWAMGSPCSCCWGCWTSSMSLPVGNQGTQLGHEHGCVRAYLLLEAGTSPPVALYSPVSSGLHSSGSWEAEHILLWQFKMSAN